VLIILNKLPNPILCGNNRVRLAPHSFPGQKIFGFVDQFFTNCCEAEIEDSGIKIANH
jgi:hypothetical protein